ncbi:MAG TPA: thioesterase family protein [Bacillaceae bacterium]
MSNISYIDNMEEWKSEFVYYHEIKVRFSETDMFGHVNNTAAFIYFEEARIEYLKHKGFMQDWMNPRSEAVPVVADLQCDYLAQIYFDEKVKMYVKTNRIGTSSVDLHYMGMKEDGTVCFTGRGAMVQYSKRTGKSLPWTEDMKRALA